MRRLILALFVLGISLFATQCWAQSVTCLPSPETEGPLSCSNTFSPGTTTGTYDFSRTGDGVLIVRFVTVLTTFTLTVTINHTIDPFDPSEFPPGTVAVTYSNGKMDQYDFTGNAGGPNGVPVKGTDYQGLINLELGYFTNQTVHDPAFAHAPGDVTTFTEDILTSYSDSTICGQFGCDPTMDGSTPGLSSVVAADEPLADNSTDSFCSLTLTATNNPSEQKPEIEVALSLASGACGTGPALRDKTARLSVSTTDSNGNVTFPALKNVEANKFHWDNKNGLNEYDISTDGLVSGQTYTVTVYSTKISPQSKTFVAP
jgi:hypothetical protein